MKTTIALAAALAVFALPVAANAATQHRHQSHHRAGYGAYARAPGQIACTQYGCLPVPRGCYPRGGHTYSGMPSGFDVVVCGNSSLYGNY
jgi:hypothetical protein